MSIQFGICNFDGKPIDPEHLEKVRPVLAPYGPDGEGYICKDDLAILYRAFHTTRESRREVQPYVSESGAVLTWDGRLDNREELIGLLVRQISVTSTDLEIVAACYERWGTNSFAKLIGDWALSIWDAKNRSLLLAKDFLGTRHLYYSIAGDQVTWCTILDPLVLFADRPLKLEEEYIAGWLSFFPAPQLTPYVGIHSVPPASFARLARGTWTIRKYWDFNPAERIVYREDSEYEEHFRTGLATSVRRRLRSDSPVVAELSGGMDSSSIVCVADAAIANGIAETPRLDTISYYDDSEPNWNERPYFAEVEQRRGRRGFHIDVASLETPGFGLESADFRATPGSSNAATGPDRQFAEWTASQGHRVLLSGIGGDEVTGGVPTPTPELADLLVRAQIRTLAHQLRQWALSKRRPWFHLLVEVIQSFCPPAWLGIAKHRCPAPWLNPSFVRRYHRALIGYDLRWRLFGPLPSFQETLNTLEALRRQLACFAVGVLPLHEKCYPYLDRDLLQFLFAVPPQQLLRPDQRRSLMRRALVGIVPDAILNRKRKAHVGRGPRLAFSLRRSELIELTQEMRSGNLGILDPIAFRMALADASTGKNIQIVPLLRAIGIEMWLRNFASGNPTALRVANSPSLSLIAEASGRHRAVTLKYLSAENNPK